MPSLSLTDPTYVTSDARTLFSQLNYSQGPQRVGLTGPNGSGKSTLLALISRKRAPTSGVINLSGTVLSLEQSFNQSWAQQGEASALTGLDCARAMAILTRIAAGLGCLSDFDRADWTLPARIEAALRQVGLEGLDLQRSIKAMSGGERTRLALARLIVHAPDFIVMDEPTNNLDLEGRALIADFIENWQKGMMVASHDRRLLDQMDHIAALSAQEIRVYGPGWTAFAHARAQERAQHMAEAIRAEKTAKALARTAQIRRERLERRAQAGKRDRADGSQPKVLSDAMKERAQHTAARQAKLSKARQDAAELQCRSAQAALTRVRDLTMTHEGLQTSTPHGHLPCLILDEVSFAYEDGPPVFDAISLTLYPGERLHLKGGNGSGKSTLVALIEGRLHPSKGSIHRGGPLSVLDQDITLLKDDETLMAAMARLNPALPPQACHAALARFAFRNVDGERQVFSLSGGERLRAGLACVMGATAPDLLILDEPTNHLDIEVLEALEAAITEYRASLILVSHDKGFTDNLTFDQTLNLGVQPH